MFLFFLLRKFAFAFFPSNLIGSSVVTDFCTNVADFCTAVTDFALLLLIFVLLFGITVLKLTNHSPDTFLCILLCE